MMKKLLGVTALFAAFLVLSAASQAHACVGKTLVIGSVDMPSVNMVSEMISILVMERTGTTVVIGERTGTKEDPKIILKKFPDYKSCYQAAKEGKVDIIVDFTGRGYVDVLKKEPEADADTVYQTVKEVYERELNLVWLGQLGFSEPGVVSSGDVKVPAMAATIITKETMAKFPALPRVLDKLTGRLDNASVEKLVSEIGNGDDAGKKAAKVTRKFLKSKRLI